VAAKEFPLRRTVRQIRTAWADRARCARIVHTADDGRPRSQPKTADHGRHWAHANVSRFPPWLARPGVVGVFSWIARRPYTANAAGRIDVAMRRLRKSHGLTLNHRVLVDIQVPDMLAGTSPNVVIILRSNAAVVCSPVHSGRSRTELRCRETSSRREATRCSCHLLLAEQTSDFPDRETALDFQTVITGRSVPPPSVPSPSPSPSSRSGRARRLAEPRSASARARARPCRELPRTDCAR